MATIRVMMVVCCLVFLITPMIAVAVEPETKPVEPVPAAAVQDQKPAYRYDPTGRREPFKSLLGPGPGEPGEILLPPKPIGPGPLQKFELNQLHVIGIILSGSLGDYARILAPDGKTYTVKVGDPIGRYEGKIIAMTDKAVVVKEIKEYQVGEKIEVREPETQLYLNPLEKEQKS
jgi:Tfp pilus assembly protein PilP